MSDSYQTKILDSKTWVFSLKHFTKQNRGHKEAQQNSQKEASELQYVIAASFDCWLALRLINCEKHTWQKFLDLRMTMPVVNSFLEFDQEFKPVSMALAYFDGSIEWCPWDKIYKLYPFEVEAGKKRSLSKTHSQVLKETPRPAYINAIVDESENLEETLMLETIIFLYKKGSYIYAINFKGELKIFKVIEAQMKIKLVQKFQFGNKVVQSQLLQNFGSQNSNTDSFIVAICFEKISTPIVLQISSKTTYEQLKLKIQKILQNPSLQQSSSSQNIKHITYNASTESLITCTQQNEIKIFFLEKVDFLQKDFIVFPQLQKVFQLPYKDSFEIINDISVKQNILLILCTKSFYMYDIREGTIKNESQKLKETLDMGKLVSPSSTIKNGKPVLLIKKKFNVLDPKQRSSTTLHLFTGK